MVVMVGPRMSRSEVISYVQQQAPIRGVDPAAALAIAEQEGLGGEGASSVPGDNGTSFGPWQLHAGGRLPAEVWAQGASFAQSWAWSQQGIDYALTGIAGESSQLEGAAAVAAISRKFEAPCRNWDAQAGRCMGANPGSGIDLVAKETALAVANLSKWNMILSQGVSIPGTIPIPPGPAPTPKPSPNPPQLPAVIAPVTGLVGALQTLIAGTIGPNLANLNVKPNASGLILLLASLFAILIGALIWRGDDVKSAVAQAPKWVAAA